MSNITVLGTGVVGQTVAARLDDLGHNVIMGTRHAEKTQNRDEQNPMTGTSFKQWYSQHPNIKLANYKESVDQADIVINATSGQATMTALNAVGKDKLNGKVLLDIANPLDFSNGMPPHLSICNTDSLGEQIQREFPDTKVVKGLNTMNAYLMVKPDLVPGDHNVFISGNDQTAKQEVGKLLKEFGWKEKNIIDLGDISTARGTEQLLPIWLRLWQSLGTPEFNFHIVKK